MGIDIPSATPNWAKIQQRREAIITGIRKGMQGTMKANKMTHIEGRAVVTSPGRIRVQSNGQTRELEAGKIILATGSESIELRSMPFDGQTIISSKEALSLPQIPKSMLIVGGGVIGCEMACAYAAFGTKVTIVEALERLLPMEDSWISRILEREFKSLGIDAVTGRKVMSVDKSASPAKVSLDNGQVIEAEKVLVAVGRRATVDKETVEALKLEMNGPADQGQQEAGDQCPRRVRAGRCRRHDVSRARGDRRGGSRRRQRHGQQRGNAGLFADSPRRLHVPRGGLGRQDGGEMPGGGHGHRHRQGLLSRQRPAASRRTKRTANSTPSATRPSTSSSASAWSATWRPNSPPSPGPCSAPCEPIRKITFPHPTTSETIEDAVHEALGELLLEEC